MPAHCKVRFSAEQRRTAGWTDVLGWVVIRGCRLHTCLGKRMCLPAVIIKRRNPWVPVPSFPASCPPAAGWVRVWPSILEAGPETPQCFPGLGPPTTLPARRCSGWFPRSLARSLAHWCSHLPQAACLPLCEALLLGTSRLQQNEAAQTQGGGGGMREEDRSGLR